MTPCKTFAIKSNGKTDEELAEIIAELLNEEVI